MTGNGHVRFGGRPPQKYRPGDRRQLGGGPPNYRHICYVHGLALAPDLGRLFASATGENRLVAIDLSTLRIVGSAPTGDYPDGLTYDPDDHKVFVSNEHGGTDTVIDVNSNQRVADIQVGSDVGNTQYDSVSRCILVGDGAFYADPRRRRHARTALDRECGRAARASGVAAGAMLLSLAMAAPVFLALHVWLGRRSRP